jgi:hypothetical protein
VLSEAEFTVLRDRMAANCGRPAEAPAPAITAKQPRRGRKNKLEARFEREYLQPKRDFGHLVWFDFEPIKFRLADGAWYTPDFISQGAGGSLVAWETKGFWREAARIRIKVAADKYPWIQFIAVTRDRKTGEWKYEHFHGREK